MQGPESISNRKSTIDVCSGNPVPGLQRVVLGGVRCLLYYPAHFLSLFCDTVLLANRTLPGRPFTTFCTCAPCLALMPAFSKVLFLLFVLKSPPTPGPQADRMEVHFMKRTLADQDSSALKSSSASERK